MAIVTPSCIRCLNLFRDLILAGWKPNTALAGKPGLLPVGASWCTYYLCNSNANNQRPASFFEAFGLMCRRCQPLAPKHKFKFKNKLFSLDATVVSLCPALFPWAACRRTKGGIKLHTLLDHEGYLQLNLFRSCTVREFFEPPEMITDNMCPTIQLTLALA